MTTILILGSAPMAVEARTWARRPFDAIVAINNAHAIRSDWDYLVYPWDFPANRLPRPAPGQRLVSEENFVPAQNAHGGFVYAGGTMAFTAAYWALQALRPRCMAFFGCDMHYPSTGPTHFYGTGTADPLRPDVTLRSIEAKSARFMVLAARAGCRVVNLSTGPSRLVFPRASRQSLSTGPLGDTGKRPIALIRPRSTRLTHYGAALRNPSPHCSSEACRHPALSLERAMATRKAGHETRDLQHQWHQGAH
jgi:hypothetical protein